MKRHLLTLCAIISLLAAPARALASNEEAIATLNLSRFALPEYPPGVRQAGIAEGTVIVALETRQAAAGPVGEFLVLSASDPRFIDSVNRAIRAWQFAAPKAGQPTLATIGSGPTVIRFQFVSTGVVMISVPDFQAMRTASTTTPVPPTIVLPTFSDLDRAPTALAQPMPAYPAALRAKPVPGTAAVRFYVDTEGRVRLPTVTSASGPEFAEAALGVLANWRFEPPQLSGKPVIAIGTWTFNFGPTSR
ncbi:MAG TPA: energy transducer TonB [Opitutaceae bacterium]